MAGARAAAAAASAGSSASSGNQQPQEPGLGELLEEFSRTQYRAKDGSGTGGSKSSYPQTWRASCQLRQSPP
ncbi:MTMR14 isoform 12 [Pongo abelii]|uniref:MTMR14 isoform 12 n=1 Tax=Pongo abelii TaxID=9601 RepID=A0A2J8WDU7_PONAB|nr:MTMR14 isoform 12 [Pongo abelii]